MVKDTKGSLNQHPMRKNRASRQFFFITASSARGRAHPTRPRAQKFAEMPSSGTWARGRAH
ncbi:hypothetical protein HanXRQr2_Chr14g0620521 [Helianthus annuus]|uniref:Uncharacterized protein n=1 Tax=Helianthus annuus TaxID=4232 RepID=A0A9K3H4M6_HELAN|nr:hypothetical protein HanXRQr2_Chr14g0620521 [Helianthus annuus]